MKTICAIAVLVLWAGVWLPAGADEKTEESGSKPAEGLTSAAGTAEKSAAVETLIACLQDEDEDVRQDAAVALGNLGDARAVDALIACLKDENEEGAGSVAEALGKLGSAAVDPLIAGLRDENNRVRYWAAQALGAIGDARAMDPLIASLKKGNGGARYSAAQALETLKYKPETTEARVTFLIAKWDWEQLVKEGPAAVEPLIACLKDESIRTKAAEVLGQLGDVRAVEPLIACLKDADANMRYWTISALGKLGDGRAVKPLIACLEDEYGGVRQDAADALGQLGDARAVEPLVASLKDKDESLCQRAAEALGKLGYQPATMEARILFLAANRSWDQLKQEGPAAADMLVSWLKDKSAGVRSMAAAALETLGYNPATPDARITFLIAKRAWEPLVQEGSAAVKPLIDCLMDENEELRDAAAEVLVRLGVPEVKPFIEEGTRLLKIASADLNGDGTPDYILVLEKEKEKPEDPDIEKGQRPLLILARDATGALKLVKRNDKIVSCSTCDGGVKGDPFDGVKMGTKTFTVRNSGVRGMGTWGWWTEYKFNYSRIDNTWQLVRSEEGEEQEVGPAPARRHVEAYAPPKDYGKIDIADFDPQNYLGKGER